MHVHKEEVDNHGKGVCACGRVQQYNLEKSREPPVLVKAGDPDYQDQPPGTKRSVKAPPPAPDPYPPAPASRKAPPPPAAKLSTRPPRNNAAIHGRIEGNKPAIISYMTDGHSLKETADYFKISRAALDRARERWNLAFRGHRTPRKQRRRDAGPVPEKGESKTIPLDNQAGTVTVSFSAVRYFSLSVRDGDMLASLIDAIQKREATTT